MKTAVVFGLLLAATSAAFADFSYTEDNLANRTPVQVTGNRVDVEAELASAQESGDLIGLHGAPFNRISPYAFPAKPVVAGLSRAQVQAALARAISEGDMLASNESGLMLNQQSPTYYARAPKHNGGPVMAGDIMDKHIPPATSAE